MDFTATSTQKCRLRLGLKQYDVNLTEEEDMQTQYKVLGYRIDLYFQGYKLAIEIDENWHSDRNSWLQNKKTKSKKTRTWL